MPLIPIIAGSAFVAGLVAWGLGKRAERKESHALDDPDAAKSPTQRRRIEATLVILLGLVFVSGLMFDAFDRGTAFGRFDQSVADYGASQATTASTAILDAITTLGGTRLITALTVITAAYAIAVSKSWVGPVYLTLVSAGQALINNGIKWSVARERPNISQLADFSGSSFPSGHSAAAAATFAGIAFVLVQQRTPRVRVAIVTGAVVVAMAVAATRALLGVHWLTDVIAGVAIGWAWFLLVTTFMGRQVSDSFDTEQEHQRHRSVDA